MFAAILRASSLVSGLAAERRQSVAGLTTLSVKWALGGRGCAGTRRGNGKFCRARRLYAVGWQLAAKDAGDRFQKCKAENNATPEAQMLAGRLWQFDATDTASKLNDPSPLTPAERNALVQVHNRAVQCRAIIISYDNQYAAWEAPVSQNLFQRADQIFQKLASGELPVGTANKLIIENNGQFQSELSRANANAVAADAAARQRAAELLIQSGALRPQPPVQLPPSPTLQAPRMTTTNCNWLGNTLNCTSM
jgi:hypothetical protein